MKRFHVHVSVNDLEANVKFYSTVFGARLRWSSPTTRNGWWTIYGSISLFRSAAARRE